MIMSPSEIGSGSGTNPQDVGWEQGNLQSGAISRISPRPTPWGFLRLGSAAHVAGNGEHGG